MNIKRAILIVILLVLIGLRHFLLPDEMEEIGFKSIAPTLSSLSDIHIKIETLIKHLIDSEMKAPPDQDYLISMIIDKLEMMNLICFYNREMLETLVDGDVTAKYRPVYLSKLKNNIIYEMARIENNMEKITSIYPLIKEKEVSDTIKKSQQIGQTLIQLFEDTVMRLSKLIRSEDV